MYDEGSDDRRREVRQERARNHPLRQAILALLALDDGDREMTHGEMRAELPDAPTLSVVAYHLMVLHAAELVSVSTNGAGRLYSLA